MKKILLALILITTSAILSAYSKPLENTEISLSGFVHVYGNEPFSFLGFKSDDGRELKIQADKDILSELQNSQGKKIEITGLLENSSQKESQDQKISPDMLKDGIIIVSKWKPLSQQQEDIMQIHSIN